MEKVKVKLLIIVLVVFLLAIGVSYAYLTTQVSGNGVLSIDIQAGTADSLTFDTGNPINIEITKDNFGKIDQNDYVVNTIATARLLTNDVTNHASATYNVFLVIDTNDFIYTVNEQTPEIYLKITDPSGNMSNVESLNKYDKGYDITNKRGVYKIATNHTIEATGSKEETWQVEVRVVNLDTPQYLNANKTLNAKLYMTTESIEKYQLAHVSNIKTDISTNSISLTPEVIKGTNKVNRYYYGITEANNLGNIEYLEGKKSNYTFDNLDPNKEYKVFAFVQDSEGFVSNVYSTNVSTADYEIPVIEDVKYTTTLTDLTLEVTASSNSSNIINYYYSIDNGANYTAVDSSSYTFSNLMNNHNYQVKIKVEDENGKFSTDYMLIVER